MPYPPPPGASSGAAGSGGAHPSLPSRPPQGRSGGFKSAFSKGSASAAPKTYGAAPTTYGAAPTTYGAAPTTYGAAPTTYGTAPTTYGAAPTTYGAAPSTYGAAPSTYGSNGYDATPAAGPVAYPAQSYGTYGASAGAPSNGPSAPSTTSSVPSMRNPFPAPGTEYNADMAAQIAQWQSAYGPRDANAAGPIGPVAPGDAAGNSNNSATNNGGGERKKTVYREGGGKKWQDDTLLEWDPSHLRLFVGNLAGETTDESLLKAFSRWKSVQKARVIREKRTSHSKQYGFVSFSDPDDFFQAAKEMNGKYIQSHPVVVRKAKTEIKVSTAKDHRNKGKWGKNNNKGGDKKKRDGNGSGAGAGAAGGGYEAGSGTMGAGVTKPGQKMKNGLRLLG
ncbi:hypothetical protein TD95_001834 [Thielaviopsis punctulata]|uniref:RRM domain-containing protein n=1 Tax=Thielaviopsis punctulata TaxID=72032 RepID=A0A0F4ZBH4_9PEZI|nr:hypothetical protein TD95_001834 [Thielaviopsis punctulata]